MGWPICLTVCDSSAQFSRVITRRGYSRRLQFDVYCFSCTESPRNEAFLGDSGVFGPAAALTVSASACLKEPFKIAGCRPSEFWLASSPVAAADGIQSNERRPIRLGTRGQKHGSRPSRALGSHPSRGPCKGAAGQGRFSDSPARTRSRSSWHRSDHLHALLVLFCDRSICVGHPVEEAKAFRDHNQPAENHFCGSCGSK